MVMDITNELIRIVFEGIKESASPIFLNRVRKTIEESPTDKEGLLKTIDRVKKMVELFIDKELAKNLAVELRKVVEGK